jgi:HlyD family secretion protein
VVTYETIINVDNKDLKLRPGMTANVSIVVASRENILRVPNAALRVRLPEGTVVTNASTPAASAPPVSATLTPTAPPARPERASGTGERPTREGGGNGRRGGGFLPEDATPELRQKAREIIAELGIDFRNGPPTAEQREQIRKLLIERGVLTAPTAGQPIVTPRTVYRLPKGDKNAAPEAVPIKVGITDGSYSEATEGLAAGDVVITGLNVTPAGGTAAPTTSNPFSGGRRF